MGKRVGYPSDVSDEEWAFVVGYLALCREDAKQREHSLRAVFTIASVYFDFVFLADGKETNRGSETWVLVKGSDGWRIAGMTYSSNPPVQ